MFYNLFKLPGCILCSLFDCIGDFFSLKIFNVEELVHSCACIQVHARVCAVVWCIHVHIPKYTLACVQMYGTLMCTHPGTHSRLWRCMVHSCAHIHVHIHVCAAV